MAEIMARLQFETPSSFSARDEFDQTAGNLNAKVAPVGGTWATSGAATDLAIEATGHTAQRTAVSEAARHALLGAVNFTNVGVEIDVKASALIAGLFQIATARDNEIQAALQFNAGYPGGVFVTTITGTSDSQQVPVEGMVTAGAWSTIRLVVDAAGRYAAWLFPQGGRPSAPLITGQHAALATGGASATGLPGFSDANTSSTACTRNYKNFRVFVPTVDAACFASQSLVYSHEGAFRENAAGTQWAEKTVSGRNLYIPCSGAEGRTPRVLVMGSRFDPDTMQHEFGDLRATLTITERYLGVPGA